MDRRRVYFGGVSWPDVDTRLGERLVWDDSGRTPPDKLAFIRAIYLAGIQSLLAGNGTGAERAMRDLQAQTPWVLPSPENHTNLLALVRDLGAKLEEARANGSLHDLAGQAKIETGWIEAGVTARNKTAEDDRRREALYKCAAAKVGQLANVPGVPELVCGYDDLLAKAKRYALVGAALGAIYLFRRR